MDRVKSAAKQEIGRSEFLDEYITPENYRPESHKEFAKQINSS